MNPNTGTNAHMDTHTRTYRANPKVPLRKDMTWNNLKKMIKKWIGFAVKTLVYDFRETWLNSFLGILSAILQLPVMTPKS